MNPLIYKSLADLERFSQSYYPSADKINRIGEGLRHTPVRQEMNQEWLDNIMRYLGQ